MSLSTTKKVTLTGSSQIGGTTVVSLNAAVGTDDSSTGTVTQSIINSELYAANKTEVRKDISDFQNAVYDLQDSMSAKPTDETNG